MRVLTVSMIVLGCAAPALAQDKPKTMRGSFISPVGEPYRPTADGVAPDLAWFQAVDTNHDGRISLAEFRADAARFFKTLDVNKDGEIDPPELDRYENEVAPELRDYQDADGGGRHRHSRHGSRGPADDDDRGPATDGGRYDYLGLPEPIAAADTNFNRGVSAKELDDAAIQRFHLLDTANHGYLTRDALPPLTRGDARRHKSEEQAAPPPPPPEGEAGQG